MSKIRLHGTSSGYTEIAPVAASGNNTLTLPNDGTIISKDSNGAVGVTSVVTTTATITTAKVGAAVTISESGIEASGIGITCANINGAQIGGRRNIVINGAMQVAQRATSATGKNSTGYYCTDRFRLVDYNIGTFTLAQQTSAPTGFNKSLRLDCTTADTSIAAADYLSIDQAIEGFDLQQLDYGLSSAKTITISFYVKSTTTGTYTLEIYMNNGDYFNSKTYTISSANTWERKIITFVGNTSNGITNDNTRGLTCNFWLSNGSNFEGGTFSDGTWHNTTNRRVHSSQVNIASSTDNDWSITGVQLEVGSQATAFEQRSFNEEIVLCQRYYEKSYNHGDVPGTNTSNGSVMFLSNRNSGTPHTMLRYATRKRAAPTLVAYATGAADTTGMKNLDANTVYSNYIMNRNGEMGCTAYPDATPVIGQFIQFHYTADAEL